jgi:putative DNA primase/helicase
MDISADVAQGIYGEVFSGKTAIEPSSSPETLKFTPLDLDDFLALRIPPREMIMSPIIPEKGLAMLYAARGCGKTHVGLGIGYAVASGGSFLKWRAPKARRVLCIDGEMPASALQDRLKEIVAGAVARPNVGMLNLLSADIVDGGLGNLADPKVQAEFDSALEGIELLILDNLSSLTSVIRDNDAESWSPIQNWLLRLRRRGVSVLIIHHAGKGGGQRGTSRREDVLDTSISLRRPCDYIPDQGARFEVHIEKGRRIHGTDAKPFEAKATDATTPRIVGRAFAAGISRARRRSMAQPRAATPPLSRLVRPAQRAVAQRLRALARHGHGPRKPVQVRCLVKTGGGEARRTSAARKSHAAWLPRARTRPSRLLPRSKHAAGGQRPWGGERCQVPYNGAMLPPNRARAQCADFQADGHAPLRHPLVSERERRGDQRRCG